MKSSITVICGHYGCGKTNLVLNLAAEAAQRGRRSVVVDMDVVNPYFRSSDYSALLKKLGVELIAPVFANTTLDTPVLPPEIFSILEHTEPGAGGEIQLTDAMLVLARRDGMIGVDYTGTRYDMGNKLGILQAAVEVGLKHPEVGEDFRKYLKKLAETL